tara:strand:+ start:26568 stop:27038 length:471 start_codon:yes stop_codon:yes gene_type:complete
MGDISNKAAEAAQAFGGFVSGLIDRIAEEARIIVPSTQSVPYKTNMYVGNRRVMAVRIPLGALPNSTTKVVPVPTAVTDVWDPTTAYLDTSNCFARSRTTSTVLPLPHSTSSDFFRTDNGIQITLTGPEVYIGCQTDMSGLDGFATVHYLEALPTT